MDIVIEGLAAVLFVVVTVAFFVWVAYLAVSSRRRRGIPLLLRSLPSSLVELHGECGWIGRMDVSFWRSSASPCW